MQPLGDAQGEAERRLDDRAVGNAVSYARTDGGTQIRCAWTVGWTRGRTTRRVIRVLCVTLAHSEPSGR